MVKPNFIGVGGHKCASTWLSECMRDHPEIFMSNPKEIGYFVNHLDKGDDWYFGHFAPASCCHYAVGEFTSYYLYDLGALREIRSKLGAVKILCVIREPVERAISQIKHGIRNQSLKKIERIKREDLEIMVEKYPIILDRSKYVSGLEYVFECFGKENVLVLNQADFTDYPRACLSQVWRFLGVSEDFFPERANAKISAGIIPKYQFLENARQKLYRRVRELPGVIPIIKKSGLPEIYRRFNSSTSTIVVERCGLDFLHDQLDHDWSVASKYCFDPR